jgi:ATP-dependent exoDNAse (exonuclease V) beta subunit
LVKDPEEVSEAAIDDIIRQTEAGLEAVRQLESESLVHSCHNKLGVTLDWEAATIVGDIDHLSVTDDGYVMTDFKTSTVDETTIADRTEHYSLQLLAYGGALMQADAQAERVTIAVVYTDAGTTRSRTLTRQDIESLLGWADEVLEEVAFVERR